MSKKAFMATIIITVFVISLVAGMQAIKLTSANPYFIYQTVSPIPGSVPPQITIFSPQDNITYNSNILIGFNVSCLPPPQGDYFISDVEVKLDSNPKYLYDFMLNTTSDGWTSVKQYNLSQNFNLCEGNHSLTVEAVTTFLPGGLTIFSLENSTNVSFTVDTTPPSITGLSLENTTYNSNTVPLNFNVDKTASWIAYTLDNQNNVTISENVTLTGLSDGSHKLTVYANDTAGNIGKSDTVSFAVKVPTPSPSPTQQPTLPPLLDYTPTPSPTFAPPSSTIQPSPSPTPTPTFAVESVLVLIIVLAVVVVVTGVLVYLRRIKKQK